MYSKALFVFILGASASRSGRFFQRWKKLNDHCLRGGEKSTCPYPALRYASQGKVVPMPKHHALSMFGGVKT